MTKHDAITLAALISEWGLMLGEEINRLDSELPLEHLTETDYRYIGKDSSLLLSTLFVNKADRPDLFEPYKRPLQLTELDGLRAIVERMAAYVEALRDSDGGE